MSLIAGMTAGFGQGQGEYNKRMLDFINQKNQTMANMYSHLADNAQDQDVASEFTKRAMGWASANPMMDPKGYQQLIKGEKVGLHDLVDQAHQNKVANYHQATFGVPASGMAGSNNNSNNGFIPGSISGQHAVPAPQMLPTQPQSASVGQVPAIPPLPPSIDFNASGQPPALHADGSPVTTAQANGQPQDIPPIQSPTPQMTPPPSMDQQAQPQSTAQLSQVGQGGPPSTIDMDTFIRHGMPPEPPMYGALGRLNPEWQQWHEIYNKKMEGTVATPAAMQGFMGSPYMPAGFASPYASMMGRELQAGARAVSQGYKIVNGQFVPMNPEEYSLSQNLKMMKDKAQAELEQASIPLKKMMTQYYSGKTQMIPMEMKVRLAQLGLEQQRVQLYQANTNARIFGTDPQGRPIPGALAMDDGSGNITPIGSMWSHNVLPTNATQLKSETAIPVMQQTTKLAAFASDPNNADLFGKVQGNLENFIAGKFGTGDPREAGLRADLISLASLMVPLHGFRSQKAAEEFMGRLGQGMSPTAFGAALTAFNNVGQNLYQNGMPSLINSTGGASPRMALPPGQTPSTKPNITKAPPQVQVVNQKEWDALIAKGHTPDALKKAGITLGK